MRFFHSYWSKPGKMERWRVNESRHLNSTVFYFGLSVAYIKRLGYQIDLYTDTEGKNLLGHLPYDNIYIVLDEMDENIPGCNWAAGKIESLKHANLGDVYIDGDVFIKTENCVELIKNGKQFDGFFQGHENIIHLNKMNYNNDSDYIYYHNNKHMENYTFPENIPIYGQDAYNAGLILFNNQQYKDEFIKAYDYVLEQVIKDKSISILYEVNRHLCFDLVMEQRFLYEIGKSYNVGTLLDYWKFDNKNVKSLSLNTQANEIGYQHVIGSKKYQSDEISKCKEVLNRLNPEIYQSCLSKIETL